MTLGEYVKAYREMHDLSQRIIVGIDVHQYLQLSPACQIPLSPIWREAETGMDP